MSMIPWGKLLVLQLPLQGQLKKQEEYNILNIMEILYVTSRIF